MEDVVQHKIPIGVFASFFVPGMLVYSFLLQRSVTYVLTSSFAGSSRAAYWVAGAYGAAWLAVLFVLRLPLIRQEKRLNLFLKGLEYGLISSVATVELLIIWAAVAQSTMQSHPLPGSIINIIWLALVDYGTYGMLAIFYFALVGLACGPLASAGILLAMKSRPQDRLDTARARDRMLAVESLGFSAIGLPISWLIIPGGVFSAIGAILSVLRLRQPYESRAPRAATTTLAALIIGIIGILIAVLTILSLIFHGGMSH